MKKTFFFVGALLASCFSLTSCSGGGDGNDSVNVAALSGRLLRLESPNNVLGAMYVQVRDRIGSSNGCEARFYFGTPGSNSAPGQVRVLSTVKSEESKKSWDKIEITFHINDAEISEEVNFKSFFALWLASASSAENADDTENGQEGGGQDAGGMDADSYVTGMEPMKVTLIFDSNDGGDYYMEPTTIYLDDSEEVVQTIQIEGDFYLSN